MRTAWRLGIYSFLFVQVYLHHQKLIPTSELGYTVPILLFAVSLGLSLSFRIAVLVNTSIVVVMLLGTYYFNEQGYGSNLISILLTYGIAIGMGYMYERELRIGFHRMNKVVKLNEDLEETNKTNLRLLSIISHDINGPLHNLSTTMDMKESSDLSDEEFKPIFHQIKIKIPLIEQLLYSVTNWAKSQTDGFQPDIEPTPLQEVFDIVGAGVRPLSEDKTINLKFGINGAIKVMTDRNMLSIVMRNVIANGIKYSSEGSEINVTAREDGDRLHIHIADLGEGMTEETKNKLFNYTSNTKDGTHSELGTGLGMHLSKKMADHLNLDLRVQSELGKGTTFSFTVPLA